MLATLKENLIQPYEGSKANLNTTIKIGEKSKTVTSKVAQKKS